MQRMEKQNGIYGVIPIWKKYTLTIQEAAEYFHIGEKKIRKIVEDHADSDFVFTNGNRVMIKRKSLSSLSTKQLRYKFIKDSMETGASI